jgi:C4-type Zn-finger protein
VHESIRSSFSSFTLADGPILKTDYQEDDDGNVEVEFRGKCRVRKSYIEKRDSSIVIMDDNGSSCLRSESATVQSAEASGNHQQGLGGHIGA